MTGISTLSIIVPTFNEEGNIDELIARIGAAATEYEAELIFVDDSRDDTRGRIERAAAGSAIPLRLIARDVPNGGLAGAVTEGLAASTSEWCVVLDGDLQHPPEMIPVLLATGIGTSAEVVVASRYLRGGSARGLESGGRRLVSTAATLASRAMFPIKLRNCTDPMTGFFAVRRESLDLSRLRPRGFKILLEILGRHSLSVVEEPFAFGDRSAGSSKADARQGIRFLAQLGALRFGRLSGFAAIGALGAVANLLIMAGLQAIGTWYLAAAIAAAAITIVGNFLLQERFVFADLRGEGRGAWRRFGQSVAFNGTETAVRTGVLWLLVESTVIPSLVAQALLITIGFVLRFGYHSLVVYRPSRTSVPSPLLATDVPATRTESEFR
jgi:dolichol-phosphate mannosyltransferase